MTETNEKIKHDILLNLPPFFAALLDTADFTDLREIRLRSGRQTALYYGNQTLFIGKAWLQPEISEIFSYICRNSVYAYMNEIKNGFITICGGHRIGLGGECVTENGEITSIKSISAINIRLAREFKGCAAPIINYIQDKGTINNTILISPPACGKTTMLRDIARMLSHKNKVTLIDERSELSSSFCGAPQFDIGPQTDVLSRAPKKRAINMALRSLSPDVIITDEVGSYEDIDTLKQVLGAGCKIITSIHGYSADSIKVSKGELLSLFDTKIELTRINGIPKVNKIHIGDVTYD